MKKQEWSPAGISATAIMILLVLVMMIATCWSAKAQVGEFFVDNRQDERVITRICEDIGLEYIVHHPDSTDLLYSAQSRTRWELLSGKLPSGYINGIEIESLSDITGYYRIIDSTYSLADIYVEGSYQTNTGSGIQLDWDFEWNIPAHKLIVFLVRDPCWSDQKNSVCRIVAANVDSCRNIDVLTLADLTWDIYRMHIVVTLEDENGKIIGYRKMKLRKSITTGISVGPPLGVDITIWPNPVEHRLYYDRIEYISKAIITTIQGRQVKVVELDGSGIIEVGDLSPGMYVIRFQVTSNITAPRKFIKL